MVTPFRAGDRLLVPYAYYRKLSPAQRRIYRASDAIHAITLPDPAPLRPHAAALRRHLDAEDQAAVTRACRALSDGLTGQLGVPPVRVQVRAVRPSHEWGELHGEYDPTAHRPAICLWMRTARRRQVVAYKTFLRTLLHELCHHLDYTLLGLEDSFHTEGFFKREASLYRQLTESLPVAVR